MPDTNRRDRLDEGIDAEAEQGQGFVDAAQRHGDEPIDEVVVDGEIGQQTGAGREDDAVALRRLRLRQKLSLF
jgi:hypothetical protein